MTKVLSLHGSELITTLRFRYPSVIAASLVYAVSFSYASIEPAATVASLFVAKYHFDTARIGLALGLSTLIGSAIGEVISGPIMDSIVRRARLRRGGEVPPAEDRLQAIWSGVVAIPVGSLILSLELK